MTCPCKWKQKLFAAVISQSVVIIGNIMTCHLTGSDKTQPLKLKWIEGKDKEKTQSLKSIFLIIIEMLLI